MAGRILVLDDEENYAQMLQELLSQYNYCVDISTRPERAIDQLEEIPYDLVISDYKMPVMDGSDFLKRARELYPNLPFILVSGLMNTPELVKVANLSVTLVMEKPLDMATFLKQVARFSSPMTDEEKKQLSDKSAQGGITRSPSFPQPPLYFSAHSSVSKSFLGDVWTASEAGACLYLLDTTEGEGELIVKDLSQWKGNSDKPIQTIDLADLVEDFELKLDAILADEEMSRVVCIKVWGQEDLLAVDEFIRDNLLRGDGLCLVFVVSDDGADDFVTATGSAGLSIPPLAQRPSDVAEYVSRCMRLASERIGKAPVSAFSEEAVYALLSNSWKSYSEIQATMTRLSTEVDAEIITLAMLTPYLASAAQNIPMPEDRISSLLKQAQTSYLNQMVPAGARSPAEISEYLELDDSTTLQSGDLNEIPLIKPALAKF